ncbi:serine beta-lactamase-like protein LACTB, mitochondrial [Periplaneta americana]|uniref:serine beta-lactamase-like protein LACTB, mitochondrial n=1 Tax=Periplaneta americana TaxID=6978 RepID=UPI0037E8ABBB
MYRKAAYIFSAAAGSLAVAYGFKNQYLKDNHESGVRGWVTAQDIQKETENKENGIFPQNQVINTLVYEKENLSISDAITKSRDLAYRLKDEVGTPGLVIGVSINGKTVWTEGIGMADVENRVPCHPETVMRIASISKSMTMAVVAKLWQDGKLDLDKAVQHYVPSFPKKFFNGEEVTITTRQLVSHLAGIRHYKKLQDTVNKDKDNVKTQTKDKKSKDQANAASTTGPPIQRDTNFKEFYIKDRCNSIQDALKLFQDDDLFFKPGESFLYTTHGWTLISAVVEAAAKEPFTKVMKDFFQVMGLKHTYLDEPEPLIYNRARYYNKNAKGRLNNVPYVDNSCKWAGGGFLSTVGDLLHFGNAMLYSYQWRNDLDTKLYPPGYLRFETLREMWTVQPKTTMKWGRSDGYGMGWVVVPAVQEHGGGDTQRFAVGHTGGAVGASSVLLMVPVTPSESSSKTLTEGPLSDSAAEICIPSGVTVAVIVNMQDVGLQHLALDVAAIFCEALKPS